MSITLSEADSRDFLSVVGVPFAPQRLVSDPDAAVSAAHELGLPVVAKLCGDNIAHKTERGLVRLGLADEQAVASATEELLDAARPEDAATGVLIAPMVRGERELIAGLSTDPQFGPTVMVGIGGIFTEALQDVSVRVVPITELDAHEMLDDLRLGNLLGEFRGEPAVDRDELVAILMGLSRLAETDERVASVDLNPLIIADGHPVAVDALVELQEAQR